MDDEGDPYSDFSERWNKPTRVAAPMCMWCFHAELGVSYGRLANKSYNTTSGELDEYRGFVATLLVYATSEVVEDDQKRQAFVASTRSLSWR